jgi:type IV pilus assembly protein PilV
MDGPLIMRAQRGTSLIEVLVTIVLVAIGLLGLAGMQSRMQTTEMESYQRAQALLLLQDMSSRISSNRANAATYVTGSGSPFGAGMTCPLAGGTATQVEHDVAEWCDALQGAAEVSSTNDNVGAMIGARGCVEQLPNNDYLVTVTWQGVAPLSAPPATLACGEGLYDDADCLADLCRRAVSTVVRIASLS